MWGYLYFISSDVAEQSSKLNERYTSQFQNGRINIFMKTMYWWWRNVYAFIHQYLVKELDSMERNIAKNLMNFIPQITDTHSCGLSTTMIKSGDWKWLWTMYRHVRIVKKEQKDRGMETGDIRNSTIMETGVRINTYNPRL